tara:strand:- start:109 stop:261 length:153 start_codon:yes stop_codon:yes gene_type:complete
MINTGLGTFETSEQEIGSLYNQTRTGFGKVLVLHFIMLGIITLHLLYLEQ